MELSIKDISNYCGFLNPSFRHFSIKINETFNALSGYSIRIFGPSHINSVVFSEHILATSQYLLDLFFIQNRFYLSASLRQWLSLEFRAAY